MTFKEVKSAMDFDESEVRLIIVVADDSVTVVVLPLPVVNLSPGDTIICIGDSILLAGTSGVNHQWYVDGSLIGGAVNDSYYATSIGHYNMTSLDLNGCIDSAQTGIYVLVSVCTAIPAISGIKTPLIYPNPTNGIIYIEKHQDQKLMIQLFDNNGNLLEVKQETEEFISLELSDLLPGVYYIRIKGINKTTYSKIIKI